MKLREILSRISGWHVHDRLLRMEGRLTSLERHVGIGGATDATDDLGKNGR